MNRLMLCMAQIVNDLPLDILALIWTKYHEKVNKFCDLYVCLEKKP